MSPDAVLDTEEKRGSSPDSEKPEAEQAEQDKLDKEDDWEAPGETENKQEPAQTDDTDEREEAPQVIMRDGGTTYVVQRGFTVEGRTYHPGDVIVVKCKYCALWKKEWGGKVRCSPGKTWDDGTPMSAEMFSCESFFICKEQEAELDNFLAMPLPEVLTVRRMLLATRRLLEIEQWTKKMFSSHAGVNPAAVFINAKGFITSFTNVDQLNLSEIFIRAYANIMAQKEKARKRLKPQKEKPVKYKRGQWVEWTDAESHQIIKGIIMLLSKGNIHIACIDGPMTGRNITFSFREWKETRSPKVIRDVAE